MISLYFSIDLVPNTRNHKKNQGSGCYHPGDIARLNQIRLARFSPRVETVTCLIMNVEILGERVAAGRDRLIVRNMDSVIEVVYVFQRHDDDNWRDNPKRTKKGEGSTMRRLG